MMIMNRVHNGDSMGEYTGVGTVANMPMKISSKLRYNEGNCQSPTEPHYQFALLQLILLLEIRISSN